MRVLVNFVRKQYFMDFCLAELQSLCELQNIQVQLNYNSFKVEEDWVHYIDLPNIESAKVICSRAVLIKNIIRVYSEGKTYEDLLKTDNSELKNEEDDLSSFKFFVDAKGKSLEQTEKLDIINKFSVFDFKGKVDLKKPERTFVIIDNTIKDYKYFGKIIAGDCSELTNFYTKFNLTTRIYLGPTSTDNELAFLMANLGQTKSEQFIYDPFVGTGSLLVPPSYFGCNTFGSDIDIRVLKGLGVGYTKKKKKKDIDLNIFTNFIEYGFKPPNIIRCDINNPVMRAHEMFDTIICDPPYGHRAFTRKTALDEDIKLKNEKKLKRRAENRAEELIKTTDNKNLLDNISSEETKEKNIESNEFLNKKTNNLNKDNLFTDLNIESKEIKKNSIEEDNSSEDSFENTEKIPSGTGQYYIPLHKIEKELIYENLLKIAQLTLRKSGLLVCLYPFKKTLENKNPTFPSHPDFELLIKCENPYSEKKSRWCLVYRKKNCMMKI